MQTQIEFEKWLNDPESKKRTKTMLKDVPLSNLDPRDFFLITEYANMNIQLDRLKLGTAARFFEHLINIRCCASNGKGGFQQKLIRTRIANVNRSDNQAQQKGFWGANKSAPKGQGVQQY
jgi:hypothetical protein